MNLEEIFKYLLLDNDNRYLMKENINSQLVNILLYELVDYKYLNDLLIKYNYPTGENDILLYRIANNKKALTKIICNFYLSNYIRLEKKFPYDFISFETQDIRLSKIINNDERIFYTKLLELSKLIILPHKNFINRNMPTINDNSIQLKNYTFLFDKVINKALRQDLIDSRTFNMVKIIINEINKNKINENIILYRGIKKYMDFKIGDIVTSKGFSSKTTDIKIANDFTDNVCCILMFKYAKNENIPLYDLNIISHFLEYELISLPNEIFEIIDNYNIYIDNDIYNVYECKHIGFEKLNPKINILNDFLLDQYENLLPFFINKLKSDCCLIIYNGDLNDDDIDEYKKYTIFTNINSLVNITYDGGIIKHYGFLEMMQILLELNNNEKSKVMLVENYSIIDINKKYNITIINDVVKINGLYVLLKYLDGYQINNVDEQTQINVNVIYDSLYNTYILSNQTL